MAWNTMSECWLCLSITYPVHSGDPCKLTFLVRLLLPPPPHTHKNGHHCYQLHPLTAPKAPTVTVERVNGTHIRVTWELRPADAGGDVLSYSILYIPVTIQRENNPVVVPGNQTSVLIGGLDPQQTYTVQVWATTAAGDGTRSAPAEITPPRIANPPGTGDVLCRCQAVCYLFHRSLFPQNLVLECLSVSLLQQLPLVLL